MRLHPRSICLFIASSAVSVAQFHVLSVNVGDKKCHRQMSRKIVVDKRGTCPVTSTMGTLFKHSGQVIARIIFSFVEHLWISWRILKIFEKKILPKKFRVFSQKIFKKKNHNFYLFIMITTKTFSATWNAFVRQKV